MEGWWIASYIVLWFLVITLAVVVVALARQIGTLHLRLGPRGAFESDDEGPALGEAPQPTTRRALDGSLVTVGGPSGWQVVLFASPTCHLCDQLASSLSVAARMHDATALVVVDADEDDARPLITRKRIDAPVVAAPDIARAYAIPGTPFVVVMDPQGVVRAKGTANNLEQLEGLIETALARADRATAGNGDSDDGTHQAADDEGVLWSTN